MAQLIFHSTHPDDVAFEQMRKAIQEKYQVGCPVWWYSSVTQHGKRYPMRQAATIARRRLNEVWITYDRNGETVERKVRWARLRPREEVQG